MLFRSFRVILATKKRDDCLESINPTHPDQLCDTQIPCSGSHAMASLGEDSLGSVPIPDIAALQSHLLQVCSLLRRAQHAGADHID